MAETRTAQTLKIAVEDDQLVIRIGVNELVSAAERGEDFQPYNIESGEFDQWKVRDAQQFAYEVALALLAENPDDGSTPVTQMLDDACLEALESGAKADLVRTGNPEVSRG